MASETLSVPEQHLRDVIKVIRAGLGHATKPPRVAKEVREQLNKWCDEEEEYLERLESDDDD